MKPEQNPLENVPAAEQYETVQISRENPVPAFTFLPQRHACCADALRELGEKNPQAMIAFYPTTFLKAGPVRVVKGSSPEAWEAVSKTRPYSDRHDDGLFAVAATVDARFVVAPSFLLRETLDQRVHVLDARVADLRAQLEQAEMEARSLETAQMVEKGIAVYHKLLTLVEAAPPEAGVPIVRNDDHSRDLVLFGGGDDPFLCVTGPKGAAVTLLRQNLRTAASGDHLAISMMQASRAGAETALESLGNPGCRAFHFDGRDVQAIDCLRAQELFEEYCTALSAAIGLQDPSATYLPGRQESGAAAGLYC